MNVGVALFWLSTKWTCRDLIPVSLAQEVAERCPDLHSRATANYGKW